MKNWILVNLQLYKIHLIAASSRIETQNSMLSVILGLCFIFTDLFNVSTLYERYPDTYKYMEWAPAWIWGVIYSSAGVLHLIALYSRLDWHRKHIVLIKSGLWLFISLCVLQADVFSPSGWCYLVFSYSAIMVFLRLKLSKEGPTHDSDGLAPN